MPICEIRFDFKFFNPQQVWLTLQQEGSALKVNHLEIEARLQPTAIAIDTRGRILRNVVQDGKKRIPELLKSISDDQLSNCMASPGEKDVCDVLEIVDSFFFEALSLYELLKRFYVGILRQAKIEKGTQARECFRTLVQKTERGVKFEWKRYLERNRDLFMHETAPWLAVEFSAANLNKRHLVVSTKSHVQLTLDDFDRVLKGLSLLSQECPKDLICKIGKMKAGSSLRSE